eukprot:TRINITY_DN1301_c2_g1_i1.p1 TRINITY_DN1301_c2_g1~~TRINITY_DN1301_c2_g1_i1.p1  ORF type:complete len:231 (+),score=53.45 TRINITY_DN1301_c2_g1_i1:100-693(+)
MATATSSGAAEKGFEFPAFYNLPPFFTLQPNLAVRAKQLSLWRQLVCDYCQAHRIFILDVSDASGSALFRNAQISRQLSNGALRSLASDLVKEGTACWADFASAGAAEQQGNSRLLIFWRSASAWADAILSFAEGNGLIGTVETVQALVDGDAVRGESFEGAPRELIIVAIQELERRGRATLMRGGTGTEGVKFLRK